MDISSHTCKAQPLRISSSLNWSPHQEYCFSASQFTKHRRRDNFERHFRKGFINQQLASHMLLATNCYVASGNDWNEQRPSNPFPDKNEIEGEAVVLTYGLFIYGDMHYITNSFSVNVLKIAASYPVGELHFLNNFCLLFLRLYFSFK